MHFLPGGGRSKKITVFHAVCLLYLTAILPLTAQETPSGNTSTGTDSAGNTGTESETKTPPVPSSGMSEDQKILDMDIRTSSLAELADWCRELGLGEGGGRDELASRLRNYYKIYGYSQNSNWDRVITIESARTTEYFTLDVVDEEYARLSGGVKISLKEENATHKIEAWEILYNRTRNIVSANGGVHYRKEEGVTVETFSGESIIINLDTWVGNFVDTISERSVSGGGTAYRFAGQVISKTDKDTTVLKRARITNAKTEEPYWSLSASRIWLFPGSDWALFNAVLKVGEIPVFYLPFFVYPADDVVFHPVLGTRTRHGYYLQTTTYLTGRPVEDPTKSNSITQILGTAAGTEKVRDGLFLRSTGKPETGNNDKIISLMIDAYTNLGFFTGIDISLPTLGFLRAFKFNAGLGWTRTLYTNKNIYSPYQADNEWESRWNKSRLFGIEVPFRYHFNFSSSASGRLGSLDFRIPHYSDPYIDEDVYLNRSEAMDWMRLIQGGGFTEETTSTSSLIGSYQWTLSTRPNLSTQKLAPYLSNISVNTITTSLSFIQSKNRSEYDSSLLNAPERIFFRPDKITAYTLSTTLSGSPVSLGNAPATVKEEAKDPLKGIGEAIAPWTASEKTESAKELRKSSWSQELLIPTMAQTWALPRNNALRFGINYTFNPSSATEVQYNKKPFAIATATPDDIKWFDFESALTNFRTDGSFSFSFSESTHNLFSSALNFNGSLQWQDHVYVSENFTQTELSALDITDYRGTQWTVNSSFSFSLNPLYWNEIFKTSGIQYSLGGLVARSLFNEQKYNNDLLSNSSPEPEWTLRSIEWSRDYITSHRLTANIGVNIFDKTQTFSFSMDAPPLYSSYNANISLNAWIWSSSASIQLQEDTDANKAADAANPETKYHYISGFILRPLYLTQNFNLGTGRSARIYTVWDPELSEWTNLSLNFSWGTFSGAYTAVRMFRYVFDNGWKQETAATGEQKLYPRDFSMSWNTSFRPAAFWDKLLSLSVNIRTSLTIDLQRYNYSRFSFNLSTTLNIAKFLDFTMGATSENAEIYRYMRDLPFFADQNDNIPKLSGEKNIFVDLINSFRFDDDTLRTQSGFKLKSFNFSAVHYLGDWNATASVSMSPFLDRPSSNPSEWHYRFKTTFSFLVRWLPVSEIEARVDYENEKFVKKSN